MSSHIFGESEETVELVTQISCSASRCSSDLLSGDEESETTQSPDSQSFSPLPVDIKDTVSGLPSIGCEYSSRLELQPAVASARAESIAWILKVKAFYGFQPLTAYLSISYLDRYLSVRQLPIDTNGWTYQLLSVACLSLAAKMEELLVPSLIHLQMEGVVAEQVFEPKTVQRMELLVLSVLGWRLRSVTPFNFLAVFANKVDPTGRCCSYLALQATDIILASVSDARLLQYRPSCIAAASLLCVAQKIEGVSYVDSEIAKSWSAGLSRESVTGCCGILLDINSMRSPLSKGTFSELHSSSSSSESSSCSSSPSPYKRRKLNDNLWTRK